MSQKQQMLTRRSVLKLLDIDGKAVDRLEQLEIIIPIRRPNRQRAYHPKDVDRLRVYQLLVNELEVNPNGAEIILRLRNRIMELEHGMGLLLDEMKSQGLLEDIKKILDSISRQVI